MQHGHEQKVVHLPVYVYEKKDSTRLLPLEAKMIADLLRGTLEPSWEILQESLKNMVDPAAWSNWAKSDGRKRFLQLKLDDIGNIDGEGPLLGDAIAVHESIGRWFKAVATATESDDEDSDNDNERRESPRELTDEQTQLLSNLHQAFEELEETLVDLQRPGLLLTCSSKADFRVGFTGLTPRGMGEFSTATNPNLFGCSVQEETVRYRLTSSTAPQGTIMPTDSDGISSLQNGVGSWMGRYQVGTDHLNALNFGIEEESKDLRDDYFGWQAMSALSDLKAVLESIGSRRTIGA